MRSGFAFLKWAIIALIVFATIVGVRGVGLGVSPPRLELSEGTGRMTLFNPGTEALKFSVETEGGVSVRPSKGEIPGLGTAGILVFGERDGIVRVLGETESVEGAMTLPGITVPVKVVDSAPLLGIWIWGMVGVLGGLMASIGAIILIKPRKKLRTITSH